MHRLPSSVDALLMLRHPSFRSMAVEAAASSWAKLTGVCLARRSLALTALQMANGLRPRTAGLPSPRMHYRAMVCSKDWNHTIAVKKLITWLPRRREEPSTQRDLKWDGRFVARYTELVLHRLPILCETCSITYISSLSPSNIARLDFDIKHLSVAST